VPLNDGHVYREKLGRHPGKTALEYLAGRYRHSTLEEWAARFGRGEIQLDGVTARGDEPLRPGQWLCWHRPPWEERSAPCSYERVYEDAELLAVDKPSGLPTLPSGGYLQNTLLHRVRAKWPQAAPLHRLGRATTGLVLFALTSEAARVLSAAWRDGQVDKRYRALSAGRAAQAQYDIDAPIGLVPHPVLGSVHGASAAGKPARSTVRVLELRAAQTLFEVHIHSGRPEQIRIHLALIGHPLAGDPLFGPGGLPLADRPGLPGDGGYLLHAETLGFTHPRTGERLRLHAAPPPELQSTAG
jgi:23S rRNA pseudouridine1911/1915/1917 synthase